MERYVDKAIEFAYYSLLNAVGMDETSRAKGHNYIPLFIDILKGKTIHIAEEKDHKTVEDVTIKQLNFERFEFGCPSCQSKSKGF